MLSDTVTYDNVTYVVQAFRPAVFGRAKALHYMTLVLVVASLVGVVASTASAQSTLADRIQSGDRRAALAMIADGMDVNKAQPDGTTPLHWAAYRVDQELVQRLLKRGARADIVNRYGASPLAEAARAADATIVA